MKDILITAKQQKRELLIFFSCFVLTNLLNVISICVYDTEWSELWTQIFWVLAISCVIYGITIILRIACWGVKRIIRKKN